MTKVELRPVIVGDWDGDNWVIDQGFQRRPGGGRRQSAQLAVGKSVTVTQMNSNAGSGSS